MSNIIIDTRIISADVLTYTDEKFHDLVRSLCGDTAVELLKILCIRSVRSLLMIDIFSVLNLDCVQPKDIKKEACFQLQNNSFVVKPGIESSIKYFKELLLAKNNEHLKQLKTKMKSSVRITDFTHLIQSPSSSSITFTITTSILNRTQPITMSIDEHKNYFKKITEWCNNNKENLLLKDFDLKENEHFILRITHGNTDLEGLIKCKCDVTTALPIKDGRFVLSNFYKHIQTVKCLMIKIIRRKDQQNGSNEQLVAASTTSPTTPTNQPTALLNTLLVSPMQTSKNRNETTTTTSTTTAPKTMKRQNTSSLVLSKRRKKLIFYKSISCCGRPFNLGSFSVLSDFRKMVRIQAGSFYLQALI